MGMFIEVKMVPVTTPIQYAYNNDGSQWLIMWNIFRNYVANIVRGKLQVVSYQPPPPSPIQKHNDYQE